MKAASRPEYYGVVLKLTLMALWGWQPQLCLAQPAAGAAPTTDTTTANLSSAATTTVTTATKSFLTTASPLVESLSR